MAATTINLSIKDVTLKILDGTSPTPLDITVHLTEGTMELYQGEFDFEIAKDNDGQPLAGSAPRQAGVRSYCGVSFAGAVFDPGDNASSEVLMDVLNDDGNVGANWVSTTASPDATMYTWDIQVTVADRDASAADLAGSVWTIPDARLVGSPEIRFQRGMATGSFEFRSTTQVKATIARIP